MRRLGPQAGQEARSHEQPERQEQFDDEQASERLAAA
jgi:hypothetical protein